jgi:hypothetical protein
VLDEIALFVQNAKNAPDDVVGKLSEDKALDYAVLMKGPAQVSRTEAEVGETVERSPEMGC